MFNIVHRLWSQYWAFLIASAIVLSGFQFLLCAIVASVDISAAYSQFLVFAPPVFRTVVDQFMLGGTPAGVIAFAWNHPVTHALVTAVAIALGTRVVAGEIENGAIELILAQPVSRRRYLAAHLLFALLSMTFVALAGLLGTIIGQNVFNLNLFGWAKFLRLIVNVLLLQSSLYSLALLFSSFGRAAGPVASMAVLVAILSYVDNVIATLWNKAAFLKPYSLHSYYDPRTVLVSGYLPMLSVIVLSVFSILAITGAFARFLTRDLP